MMRFATSSSNPNLKTKEVDSPMANDDTLAKALASVRHQRATLEAEYERVSAELTKLRQAERSLASIVEGTPLEEPADDQPKRRRAAAGERAGHPVVEAHAAGDEKVGVLDRVVDPGLAVHAHHAERERV